MTDILYNATKTSREFHADNSFCRINKGPVRSGKSVRCLIEIVRRAAQQEPASDGIRYSKWLIGRKSYPQLKSTTIKTWSHWFPESFFGKIKWDSPITHHLKFNDVNAEILFMPFESENDVDKLKSLELTGGYINELQYLPQIILTTLLERCNSYPSKTMGAPITFSAVWADTNPPSRNHWIAKLEKDLPSNYKYFHDIPAVIKIPKLIEGIKCEVSRDGTVYINNPEADYIDNLPTSDYYLNQIPGLSDEEVKVTCMGEYGFTRAGKPVYTDYNDVIHFAKKPIRYDRKKTLYAGLDFGLTPAIVFVQIQDDGTIAVIKEIVTQDVGVERFIKTIVVPYLDMNFLGWRDDYKFFGDPSGVQRQYDEQSIFTIIRNCGVIVRAASTNDPDIRVGAVSHFLRLTIGGRGYFVVTEDAQQLREGFQGDYQYEKITVGEIEESFKPRPLKNFSSHVHDALQYIMLYLKTMIFREEKQESVSLATKIY